MQVTIIKLLHIVFQPKLIGNSTFKNTVQNLQVFQKITYYSSPRAVWILTELNDEVKSIIFEISKAEFVYK